MRSFYSLSGGFRSSFPQLAAAATDAGWYRDEVAAALVELADDNVLALLANENLAATMSTLNRL
jgi:hypothetical protein